MGQEIRTQAVLQSKYVTRDENNGGKSKVNVHRKRT